MQGLQKLISLFLLLATTKLFAYCESKEDYSVMTFQFAERMTELRIRQLWSSNRLQNLKDELRFLMQDYEGLKTLFYKGYLTLDQLQYAEFEIKEARFNIRTRELDLLALDGDVEIFRKRVSDSCGQETLSAEEFDEFSQIYIEKWGNQIENDTLKMELEQERVSFAQRFLDHQQMMFRKGYITSRELRDAKFQVSRTTRGYESVKQEVEIKNQFIESISDI